MPHNTSIVGVNSPEEMNTYLSRQADDGYSDLPLNKRAFCHEYVISYNQREAAKEAGYAPSYGAKLLKEPLCVAYISHLQSIQQVNSIITKEFIDTQYMHLYEMATGQTEQRLVLPDGDEYMARKTELGTAHNILDKMSKSIEYAKETGNKTGAVSISIDFGGLRGDSSGVDVGSDPSITIEGEIDE